MEQNCRAKRGGGKKRNQEVEAIAGKQPML